MYTLASGSSGNCVLFTHGESSLLVDAGISCRKITTRLAQLGLRPCDLGAILVTHTHADHISGLTVTLKRCPVPVYASPEAGADLARRVPALGEAGLIHSLPPDTPLTVGEITARSFPTPHDAPGSVGYLLSAGGRRAAVVTDLGYVDPAVSEALRAVDLALVEANHDVDWLRSGPYPYYLQERVLGKLGHLSNETCGALSVRLAQEGTSTLVLGHLSRENNTPGRARETVARMLRSAGCDGRVQLYVAPRDELSQAFDV